MFKVVETFEKNKKNLSVVPAKWEEYGTLLWPSKMKTWEVEKIRRDPLSIPDQNWMEMPCKIKASVNSFEEGISVEKLFATFSDTESEERYLQQEVRKKKSTVLTNKLQSVSDYNSMITEEALENNNECEQQTPIILENILDNENITFATNNSVYVTDIPMQSQMQEIVTTNNEDFNIMSLLLEIKDEIQNIKNDVENLNIRQNNFEKVIIEQMAQINVKLDKMLSGEHHNFNNESDPEALTLTKELNFPLKELNQVYKMEKKLKDTDFKQEMLTRLSSICGTTKTSDGCKSMYKIMDYLFSPDLLTQFSWTGISRKNVKKNCFQKLSEIVELVFQLVFLSDCRHSRQRNEEFFKEKILKHSNQRLNRKKKNENDSDEQVQENELEGQNI